MYVLSGLRCPSLLFSSMNLGHIWSHDVWLSIWQLAHQCLTWSSSVHLVVWCSFPQVLQTVGLLHIATRWEEPKDWQFRHLLGSFFILLAQIHLPMIIGPSLITWLVASGDWSLIMRWAMHCPTDLLTVGLIHYVDAIDLGGSPISLSILLYSPSTSGLWAMGTYSPMIQTDLSFMTNVLLKCLVKSDFFLCSHWAASVLLSLYTTLPFCSFLAPITLTPEVGHPSSDVILSWPHWLFLPGSLCQGHLGGWQVCMGFCLLGFVCYRFGSGLGFWHVSWGVVC